MPLFDTTQLSRQRARADVAAHDFLLREACDRLAECLSDTTHHFPRALDVSAHPDYVREALTGHKAVGTLTHHALGEEALPMDDASVDAVLCVGTLQWVNDLSRLLFDINRILTPDGVFLAIFPGGETLCELRAALAEAEAGISGGVRPRVMPCVDVRDGGRLLQQAGFALPVASMERLTVSYADMFDLMRDLRGMGESNALAERARHFTPRRLFAHAASLYAAQHSDAEGRIVATVDLLTLSAWKKAPTQQQPLARGSGKVSLVDVLGYSHLS